jgi:hypothetical protein
VQLIAAGAQVRVRWPCDDGKSRWFDAKIVDARAQRQAKRGSAFKFKLRWTEESGGGAHWTRLAHLDYRVVGE